MTLFRIFIPTWRFFDRIGARPRLLIETADGWRPLFKPPRRHWWRLVFNPGGNLHHANQNLTDRLLDEVGRVDDVRHLTSYQIVTHLARARGARRFKLTAADQDILISAERS